MTSFTSGETTALASEELTAPPGAFLFEIAWEVCNQVGGIYQVLRSKAPTMIQRWGQRYALVGPYVPSKASLEFEPRRATGWLATALDDLAQSGLVVHHGRWLIAGRPRVLLIEHELPQPALDSLKHTLWADHAIETPPGDAMVDGVASFADGVRRLTGSLVTHWMGAGESRREDRRILMHFHEWLGGLAIPMIRREKQPVAVVFQTHATLLGRYIASSEAEFYERLPTIDQAAEADKYHIRSQHGIERACSHGSHVFATVSHITGEECKALLGRSPDVVLPNGLNIDRYNVGHDFQTFHAQFKERINRFVMGHFFPSYAFDLDHALYFFTSGRYEPRNKGFDLCVDALARVNAMLKAEGSPITVVFFIIARRPVRSLNPSVLERRGILNELREVCARITRDVGEQLFRRAAAGERTRLDDLVDDYWRLRYRTTQAALRTDQLPPVITHILDDEGSDPLLNHIRWLGLTNKPEDRVKIVYHPEFITPTNPLWGLEYEQFVRGAHLGIFPSAYEPWGYTPLECVAMGVPAITSDLAGFGRYVAEAHPDHDKWGLNVLHRRGVTYEQSAADLAEMLLAFCRLDRRGRIRIRNEVERRSWEFDWSRLGAAYHTAHDAALERAAEEERP